MNAKALSVCLVLFSTLAASQGVPPVMRYNAIVESTYLLERCGELNAERRAWVENVRGHAMRLNGWGPAEAAAHDEILLREFRERYPRVTKERCDQLARSTDIERARTLKVP